MKGVAKPRAPGGNAPAAAPCVSKGRFLAIHRNPDETEDRAVARVLGKGLVSNAATTIRFMAGEHGDMSLMDMARELLDQGEAVNRGDFAAPERLLNAQAMALNAIFNELARRAALNMGEHLGATETYLRLAFKAQAQSRATLETLAAIKNPPVVFARQANINNGGQQQVNNGQAPNSTLASARPGKMDSEPNELLEDGTHGSPQMDSRAASAAGRKNPSLEPVEAINRAAKR